MLDRIDLEPLFFAPFVSSVMQVEPAWIDYNGHLNMAYYNVLFDRCVDEAYELLGIGLDYFAPGSTPRSQPKCTCATCANCMRAIPVRVDIPAARLRRQAHPLFRATVSRDRRLGVGNVGKHDAARRHDGKKGRAVPRQVARTPEPDEGRALPPAASRGSRPRESRCRRRTSSFQANSGRTPRQSGGAMPFSGLDSPKPTASRHPSGRTVAPATRRNARARPRRDRGARARAGGGALSRRPQSGAARGGRDARRPGAGAGRRRHRQDPRADHPHRAHPVARRRASLGDPLRHLHQQGGARDEAARRRDGRADRRGHAVARHLPLDRREDPAPPRRTGRAEARLHHPGHRRPDPPAEADARGGEHRREALAGARARHRSSTAGRTAA